MIDQVKYFGKLSSIAVFTLVKLHALAMLSSSVSLFVVILSMITSGAAAPHASGPAAILVLAASRPLHCVLALLIVASGFVLVMLSGKYAVKKVIHRIVTDKSESTILPFLNKAIEKFRKGRPAIMDRASSASTAKMNLIQEARKEGGNRWLRGAVVLGLKKARLDDVDLAKDDTHVSEVIRDRTMVALQETSKPGKTMFWALILVQWVMVLIAFIF